MSRHPDPSVLYRPITATPFRRDASYMELEPCAALRPYIRCFWGTPEPIRTSEVVSASPSLIIPDTCMDIIITLNYQQNTMVNHFCALDERAYAADSGVPDNALTSTFAIRFYAWTATLFVEHPLNGSKNQNYRVGDFFTSLEKKLTPMLMSITSLNKRAEIASQYLLQHLREDRLNPTLMNAVYQIITARGAMRISELAARDAVSRKHLERIFDEHMGLSPKSFSSLVRYQLLWQELSSGRDDHVLDLVEKYGYFDQAHLLNDFKQRHTLTPAQAVLWARK